MQKDDLILITGANGMVGRALERRLRAEGLNRLLTPRVAELDMRCQNDVHAYFAHNPIDVVFHCAALVGGIKANMDNPYTFLLNNLYISANVINSAQNFGVKRLINLGSSCMYPRACAQPMPESALLTGALEPTNEGYALAKLCAQRLCQYGSKYGQNPKFITLVACNLYGPFDHFGAIDAHVIPSLVTRFVEAKRLNKPSVEIWGTGAARREFLYVDDLADAMVYFARHQAPHVMNIGTGSDVSILALAGMIREALGYTGEIALNTQMPDGMPAKTVDTSVALGLGWKAPTDLATGLKRTIDWYIAHREDDCSTMRQHDA